MIQSGDELSKIGEIFMQNQGSVDSKCTHHPYSEDINCLV